MILIIDNYDSFTYNLAQYAYQYDNQVQIIRNDRISIESINQMSPNYIIISPGPGQPQTSGISLDIIQYFSHRIPILGVCLGHQSIGYIYGGTIHRLKKPMHGKTSKIYHNQKDLFKNIQNPFQANRYHSLIISNNRFPKALKITAVTDEGIIMACQHIDFPLLRGIQFHPESLWTENGNLIIQNFLVQSV